MSKGVAFINLPPPPAAPPRAPIRNGLHPIIVFDPAVAALGPNVLPAGTVGVIPVDMTLVQMSQIILGQLSMTQDFSLRAWVSQYPDGISLLSPTWPDVFSLSRLTPRPLIIYVRGQMPPSDCILAPVIPGQYCLNILNLANAVGAFGYIQTNLA